MSLSTLVRMLVERDSNGQVVLKKGKPVRTWLTPVVVHFYKAAPPLPHIAPEQNLWREVCARFVLDALGFASVANKTPEERIKAMAEAQAYFRNDQEHASLVFAAAGIDFEPVVDEVLKIIDGRDLFREPAPKIGKDSD